MLKHSSSTSGRTKNRTRKIDDSDGSRVVGDMILGDIDGGSKKRRRWQHHYCRNRRGKVVVVVVVVGAILSFWMVYYYAVGPLLMVTRRDMVSLHDSNNGESKAIRSKPVPKGETQSLQFQSKADDKESSKQAQQQNRQRQTLKIACIGDSLTRGDIGRGITNGIDDYPTQLKNLLLLLLQSQQKSQNIDINTNVIIENFGKNGATALRGVPASYDKTNEFRNAKAFEPDIVLLGLGTNDAKFLWSPELRAKHSEAIVSSFLWLIHEFSTLTSSKQQQQQQQQSPKVFLASRPPFIVKDFQKIRQDTMVHYLHPLLDQVVANATTTTTTTTTTPTTSPSISLLAGTVDLQQVTMNNHDGDSIFINDGLHLNHDGYGLVAKAWMEELIRAGIFLSQEQRTK